jgi:hypothetical protein
MVVHIFAEFYTECFRVCPNITSTFRTFDTFEIFVKESNNSNKACGYVHDISLYQISFSYVQRFITCVHKTEYEF